jgi:23S rRNA (cytidine1920-2'-O)/16S rRNA (cytidine1409-2'-O)-methyltransferase
VYNTLKMKQRLDILLFSLKLVRSRSEGADLIKRGKIRVNGKIVDKPSTECSPEDRIEIDEKQYVGRGAYKLLKALEDFKVNVQGRNALDIGSSTGGFTEVLLEYGINHIYAVDTGSDQLASTLRDNSKVTSIENTDIRNIVKSQILHDIDLVVIDVSFISLSHILPTLHTLTTAKDVDVIALFKPQFEVGKEYIKKNGIVKDQRAVDIALDRFRQRIREMNFKYVGCIESPIKGGSGNTEYLLHIKL